MKKLLLGALVAVTIGSTSVLPVRAADIPFSVRQAVVKVFCGDYQGSGVVVNGTEGYVLTNGHIALDLNTLKPYDDCEVAFLARESSMTPSIFYSATPVKYVYDESQNRDFAVLKLGAPEGSQRLAEFPFVKTDEFSKIGDKLSIVGYPGSSNGKLAITGGFVCRSASMPALSGQYIFGDLVNGRIFHLPASELQLGGQATIKELALTQNRVPVTLQQLVGTTNRVDMRFGMSETGAIYVMTKQDGKIRRFSA